jgi:origin recognition complex subunit 5
VSPIIEEWKHQPENSQLIPPSEEERVRLIRLFSSSLTHAVENLFPRTSNAEEWCERNKPTEGFRLSQIFSVPAIPVRDIPTASGASVEDAQDYTLPRIAQFVLVASFLASHNPAKTDLRMLGHAHEKDGKRPRKRKQGATRQPRAGTASKVRAVTFSEILERFFLIFDISVIDRCHNICWARPRSRSTGC